MKFSGCAGNNSGSSRDVRSQLERPDKPAGGWDFDRMVASVPTPVILTQLELLNQLPPGPFATAYMIPKAMLILEQWPRLPTGKIDRRAVPDVPLAEFNVEMPHLPLEQIVAHAFAEVLGTGPLGRRDDFFQQGGHSLLAIRLMMTLQSRLGIAPPMVAVFRHSTVQALAEYLEGEIRKHNLVRPLPRNRNEPAYEGLSSLERRIWFLERLHPEARAYQAPHAIKVLSLLDVNTLQSSLHALAMQQEILRTTYSERDGEPIRHISEDVAIPMRRVDISPLPENEKLLAVRQHIADEIAIPFDLAHGPLTRLLILRLSATEHILLVNQHHIITDEWSGGVLLREWSALYEKIRKGDSVTLAPLPIGRHDLVLLSRIATTSLPKL